MCVCVCFLNADWLAEQSLWHVNTSFSKRVFLKKGVGLHSFVLKHEVFMWSLDMIGCRRSDALTTTHPGPPFPRTHPLLTSQYSAVHLKARARHRGCLSHKHFESAHFLFIRMFMNFIYVSFAQIIPTKNIFLTADWKEHFHTSSEYHSMKNATILFPRSRSICFFSRSC